MSSDENPLQIDQLLAGFDFAQASAATLTANKREMESLVLAFIEIIDSLETLERRCRDLAESTGVAIPVRSMAIMIKQSLKAIEQVGALPMNCVGQPLDLVRHEVVEVRSAAGITADTVVEEIQRGYLWRNRIIRQAKVVVAGEPEECRS